MAAPERLQAQSAPEHFVVAAAAAEVKNSTCNIVKYQYYWHQPLVGCLLFCTSTDYRGETGKVSQLLE